MPDGVTVPESGATHVIQPCYALDAQQHPVGESGATGTTGSTLRSTRNVRSVIRILRVKVVPRAQLLNPQAGHHGCDWSGWCNRTLRVKVVPRIHGFNCACTKQFR